MDVRTRKPKEVKEAEGRLGAGPNTHTILSTPSKLPCFGFNLPARVGCPTGAKMAKVKGSICHSCYAARGHYMFPKPQAALARKLHSLLADRVHGYRNWRLDMLTVIAYYVPEGGYFRWHDSGDLQDEQHLAAIADIAMVLNDIHFWLPTRELGIVRQYMRNGGQIPSNLTIRISAFFPNEKPQTVGDIPVAYVLDKAHWERPVDAVKCEAQGKKDGGTCGDCRVCWHRTANVAYKLH